MSLGALMSLVLRVFRPILILDDITDEEVAYHAYYYDYRGRGMRA